MYHFSELVKTQGEERGREGKEELDNQSRAVYVKVFLILKSDT